jgi:hypothetical protein
MTNPYVLATLVFYAGSLALYIWNLREPSRFVGMGATACLVVGLALHYVALLARSRQIHAVPYELPIWVSRQFTAAGRSARSFCQ